MIPKPLNRWALAIFLASAGLMLLATGLADTIEQDVGLSSLYRFRGVTEAPDDAVIIAINERSGRILGLPRSVARWPRAVHACAVDKLSKAGVSVIAFDLRFTMTSVPNMQFPGASRLHPEVSYCLVKRHNTSNDRAFAEAIQAAGNVVLIRHVDDNHQKRMDFVDGPTGSTTPGGTLLSLFEDQALAVSAWNLPAQPQRTDRFWLTHPDTGWTLPAATLFAYRRDALQQLRLSDNSRPDTARSFRILSMGPSFHASQLRSKPSSDVEARRRSYRGVTANTNMLFRAATQAAQIDVFRSLSRASQGADSQRLNYYGPSGTIRTIPFHELLLADKYGGLGELQLKNKAVFIGYSDHHNPGRSNRYNTVFRQHAGEGMSRVEIAATAFSNLLSNNSISSLKPVFEVATVASMGIAFGLMIINFSLLLSTALCALLAAAYFAGAVSLFSSHAIAMPLVIPLAVQLPIAIGFGLIISYRHARSALGRYVPVSFADTVLKRGAAKTVHKEVYGTCLITDIVGYTAIAEELSPLKLRDFLNEYLEQVQSPIYRHKGVVLDVVGDGNSAVWSSQTQDAGTRAQACRAALEIQDAVGTFNLKPDSPVFTTRIGLHSGKIVLGEIGSANYHSYAMVGDIVNTASRIESLSKQLGTALLASEQTIAGLDLVTRRIGNFQLAGKREILSIHEVLSDTLIENSPACRLRNWFETIVTLCETNRWSEAERKLLELLEEYPNDGPAKFYLRRCRSALSRSNTGDDATVISMEAK